MNIDLAKGSISSIHELVRYAGGDDKHIASSGVPDLIADRPLRAAFHDVYHFVVIVLVESRSPAGLADNQKERNADTAMIHSHKLMRHTYEWELRLVNDIHRFLDSNDSVIDSFVVPRI